MHFLTRLFKGGLIDYYNISFSGSEVILNTSESPTHLPWLHGITSFNVTAYNCAGESAPVTVYTSHHEGMTVISILYSSWGWLSNTNVCITYMVQFSKLLAEFRLWTAAFKYLLYLNVVEQLRPSKFLQ